MNISLPIGAIRKATKDELVMLSRAYSKSDWEFKDIIKDEARYPDSHQLRFELRNIKDELLQQLWSFGNRTDVNDNVLKNIQKWREAMRNPANAVVPSVTAFEKMAKQVVSDTQYKWLMRQTEDGYFLPSLVTRIEYKHADRYSPEHVTIQLSHAYFYSSDEYDDEDKAKQISMSERFYFSDLYETEETDISSDIDSFLYEEDESTGDKGDDDYDDDDDDIPKNKKKKPASKNKPAKKQIRKRRFLPLLEVFANSNLFIPTEDMLNAFFDHSRQYVAVASGIGKQYTCTTKARFQKQTNKRGDRYYYSFSAFHNMHEEGVPYKLIVDMKGVPKELERQHSTSHWGLRLLPYHPYIRCYNLTKYIYCDVHVASLKPYEYNKRILDNMIIPDKLKNYLGKIIGGKKVYTDIVAGKSGGMIILASGKPGVGKTLTAETYSEQMELPLYQIQSSQLGLDVGEIEDNLSKALRRAERWNAVLLIDECDTYVRKREKDIHQNCIVGVWLRLLEYYNGIMFLTTNMHDIIDDAILSRCAAHIKYEVPTEQERYLIIGVHSRIQGIEVSDKIAKEIAKKYQMSGRDIRNLMKNINKVYQQDGKKPVLTMDKIEAIAEFLPSIK